VSLWQTFIRASLGEHERKKTAVRVYVAGENRRRNLVAWGTTQAELWKKWLKKRLEYSMGGKTERRGKSRILLVSTLPHAGVDSNDFWREGDLKVCWDPLGGGTAVLRRSQ